MNDFKERQRGEEAKYALDEETKFKIAARRITMVTPCLGKHVPRANRQTVVTPIDAVPKGRAQVFGNRAFMLDRQIRNTAPCI